MNPFEIAFMQIHYKYLKKTLTRKLNRIILSFRLIDFKRSIII